MFIRILYVFFLKPNNTNDLVEKSYDRISSGYDGAWTNHMRNHTEDLISQLGLKKGDKVIDLTCGTGFATNLISEITGEKVIGVDKSQGMLNQARKNCNQSCEFIRSDILQFLKILPKNSQDIVTCCWGLGYSKPFLVLREIKRVLKSGGKVGVIDNSIFSLFEILYCSFLTFMEQPSKLVNIMRFRFLMGSWHLGLWWRITGMKPIKLWDGKKSYDVNSGSMAIDRLRATGAAAGFEYAAETEDEESVFLRFAEIIEKKYMKNHKITINHRYLGGIAEK